MSKILVVDDEAPIRSTLRTVLERRGYSVEEAANVDDALAKLTGSDPPELALVDLRLPGRDGTVVLEKARALSLPTEIVMISGHGSIASAVQAVRSGAYDFLEKPLDRERLLITVRNALRQARANQERLNAAGPGLLTASPVMKSVLEEASRYAPAPAPILITGETGSGKEVLARWIHVRSGHARGPFVAVNCAALPETLAESELFGHVKGAFTGADAPRKGKFVTASGGTLFLDEIGDLPPPVQAKLLRVLEEEKVQPVGSDAVTAVDVRVLAATHRDLDALCREGRFRDDLYFRVAGLKLNVPPLRERPEDVAALAEHFLDAAYQRQGWQVTTLSGPFMKALKKFSWPGNVRQLRWVVERAALLAGPAAPDPSHLPQELLGAGPASSGSSLSDIKEDVERNVIARALEKYSGNVTRAAKEVGLSRSRLYEKLEDLKIDPGVFRAGGKGR